jgi:amidophosphoribosyltransferase
MKQLGAKDEEVKEYADPDSVKHKNMVAQVAENLDLDSLMYQRLDDLVEAIGLPKEKLCTHCWDGSSYF